MSGVADGLSAGKGRSPGRPCKGSEGPKLGSLRAAAQATGGVVTKDAARRAKQRVKASGQVRDQRKFNGSEARLSSAQLDAILTLIYDDFEQGRHVDYEKVCDFAVLVQVDAVVCRLIETAPCSKDEAWRPSAGWVASYLKTWGLSSHKAQGKAASRSRSSMREEEAWVDSNYALFDTDDVIIVDETSMIWGAAPFRTIADADGFGSHVTVGDKHERQRSSLVVALRCTKDARYQLLPIVVIPTHEEGAACPIKWPDNMDLEEGEQDGPPCDCAERAVKGLHSCHWHALLRHWVDDGWLGAGDALVADNLSCHHSRESREIYFKAGINYLPLPPKVATTRSPLDNAFFAVLKTRFRVRMAKRRESKGHLPPQTARAGAIVEKEIRASLEDCKHLITAFARHNNIKPQPKATFIEPMAVASLYRETGVKSRHLPHLESAEFK